MTSAFGRFLLRMMGVIRGGSWSPPKNDGMEWEPSVRIEVLKIEPEGCVWIRLTYLTSDSTSNGRMYHVHAGDNIEIFRKPPG